MLRTDGLDNAATLADGLGRYSDRGVEPTETSPAGMGAASTTGEKITSQRFRMGLKITRSRRRPTKATSNRSPLSETPKDPERNGRTSQRLSRGSVGGGPAKLILRARGRLQLSGRDRVDQQDGSRAREQPMVPAHMSSTGMRPRVGSAKPRGSLCYRLRLF